MSRAYGRPAVEGIAASTGTLRVGDEGLEPPTSAV